MISMVTTIAVLLRAAAVSVGAAFLGSGFIYGIRCEATADYLHFGKGHAVDFISPDSSK